MIKTCDDECSEDGGGEEAASEVQQPTATSSSAPQLLSPPSFCYSSTSPLNHVYLCDCFMLSYKSELIVIRRPLSCAIKRSQELIFVTFGNVTLGNNSNNSALPLPLVPENRLELPYYYTATKHYM